ncbi:Protocatechuate 3,4-dioxygenase beta chain [Raoultella terrigena]|uniref:Protocatechuate 3,4-dioxygenase beta chain n=1 Tax=Raoultella terrigena TaxID=577 RepID=A0A4U9CZU2_RAOTE|nr:Protocatechuate 3,4-dioxygenase beta chain [Raoultella terrigena]
MKNTWWRSGRPTPAAATGIKRIAIWRPLTPTLRLWRVLTDENGYYCFAPSSRALPVAQSGQRLGPAHIHFSLSGDAWAQRLITQMYFEGDPLIKQCPIVKNHQ